MTETERKALALIAEITAERGLQLPDYLSARAALCRAIEQHEAFRQEVSDAAVEYIEHGAQSGWLGFMPFVIARPVDPLVEVLDECGFGVSSNAADDIRASLAARGLEIREARND